MAKRIIYLPNRVIDTNGISDGASIYVYETGGTTLVSIYSDSGLATPLANPYTVAAGAAVPVIYHNSSGNIRVKIVDSGGATVSDDDPYERPVTDVDFALVYNNTTTQTVAGSGSATTPGFSFTSDLNTGLFRKAADSLGVTAGGGEIAQFNATGMGIGGDQSGQRLAIITSTSFVGNALDIYQYSEQTDPDNQNVAFVVHNYTDGVSATIDTVGTKTSLILRQARNPTARADQASTFVGSGTFMDLQRSTTTGTGGNLGTGNDRLAMFDSNGCLTFYGTNATDWDGSVATAPIKIGTYTGFLTKLLYMGYNYASDKAVIGSIHDGTAFKPLDIAATEVRPASDNTALLGSGGQRWNAVFSNAFYPGAGTVFWTSGSGSPEGSITANVGSLYTRTDGGASTTLYVKESGTGNTGWVAK